MGLLKRLAGETALYGLSSIIGRFLNYLLVPLYTAVFAPSEYGIVTEIYAYIAFLNILYIYGFETAYFRFATKPGANEKHIFSLATTTILLTSTIFSGSLFVFADNIALALDYPQHSQIIAWTSGILFIDAIMAIPFARLRLQGKAGYFVTVKLSSISLNVFLNILFILIIPRYLTEISYLSTFYNADWGVEYIFLSNLIANALLIILLWKNLWQIRIQATWEHLKPMIIYAYPILFTGLAGVTNEMLSRAVLRHWLPEEFYGDQTNLAALGVFGACYKISVFMTLAVQAFRYAAEPFFFSQSTNKDSPQLFASVMNWFIIFGATAFLVISVNLDIIGYLFLRSPEYREGLYIVPFLLMGGLFLGVYYNLSVWYKLTDKTLFGAYLSIGGAVVTLLFNFLLIPYLGYLGSAITTLITYFVMAAASYVLGRKHFLVPYNLFRAAVYLLAATILYLLFTFFDSELSISLIARTVAIVVFIGLIVALERKNLRNPQ